MLRLWPERLIVFVSPTAVTCHRANHRATRIGGSSLAGLEAGTSSPDNTCSWSAAAEGVESLLHSQAGRSVSVSLVISNHFVRYIAIPRMEQLTREGERIAYARHQLQAVYGSAAAQWEIRLSGDHNGFIACAMDQEFISRLRQSFAGGPIRLQSVQPLFMYSFNAWRHRVLGPAAWFGVCEPDRLCAGLMREGEWVIVLNRFVRGSLDDSLEALTVQQECLFDGWQAEVPIYLDALHQEGPGPLQAYPHLVIPLGASKDRNSRNPDAIASGPP